MQAAGALPGPEGIGAALQALTASNMFRDMSGLAEASQLAERALAEAQQGATAAGQQAQTNLANGLQMTSQAIQKVLDVVGSYANTLAQAGFGAAGVKFGGGGGSGGGHPPVAQQSASQAGAVLNRARELDAARRAGRSGSAGGGSGGQAPGGGASARPASQGAGAGAGGSAGGRGSGGGGSLEQEILEQLGGVPGQPGPIPAFTATGGDVILASDGGGGLSVDPMKWKDLLTLQVPQAVHDGLTGRDMKLLTLEGAQGPKINLDYFPVRIRSMPKINGQDLSPAELLSRVRLNINNFLNTNLGTFNPYEQLDRPVWESNDPVGAVLRIDLAGPDNAAVVAVDADAGQWTFGTVETGVSSMFALGDTGSHPVSGFRQFGIAALAPDNVVVYTRGVDRTTGFFDSVVDEEIYLGGAAIWMTFRMGIVDFVESHGGSTELPRVTSMRLPWLQVAAQAGLLGPGTLT